VFLVFGSQSIHGSIASPPADLTLSRELDIFPMKAPEKMELINGAIGEISPFDATFGYYAHGIPPETCPLPQGWEKRLRPIQNENTRGALGLCLSVPDLACSKLAASREKDLDFVAALLVHGFCSPSELEPLIAQLPRGEQRTSAATSWRTVVTRALHHPDCSPRMRDELQRANEAKRREAAAENQSEPEVGC
jgi:hypothetical protein